MKPAILYGAKSTADKNASIPTQLHEGRELAESDGCEVVAEFSDEGASAYTGDRGPGLARARAEAERLAVEHGECVFIIQHSDRIARGDGVQAAHLVEYALWAIKNNVKIRSIQDPQTFADLLYAVVTGQRNHEDSRRKSLAVKAGLERRRSKGLHGGGPPPYGYRYDKPSGQLVHVAKEAAVVPRIFDEFLAGKSLSAIARGLEEDQVSTRRGRLWRSSTISQILSNPTYIGKLRHNEAILDGVHQPMIPTGKWEQAQDLLQARRKAGRGRPPLAGHVLRGGLLRCVCGGTMICRSEPSYESYVCERRHGRLGGCDVPLLPRRVVDSAVHAYFEQLGLDVEATRAQLASSREQKLGEVRTLSDQAVADRCRAEDRLARVRRDYIDGRISAANWSEFRSELEAELQGASAEVDLIAERLAEIETWGDLRDSERDTLAMLSDIRKAVAGEREDTDGIDVVRAALVRLFEGFRLRRVGPASQVHADLAWLGDLVIDPVVREQAVEGYTSLRPIFRREPLYDAGKNQGIAHASRLRRKLDPEHGRYVINCWGIGYRLIDG